MVGVQEVAAWPPEYQSVRPGGDAPHAGLALPIVVDGELSAVLMVSRVGIDRQYTALELGIADLLSAQVAIALRNADLHARVAESAVRDPLTGLLNRRYFDEAVESAYAAAVREKQPLSLIVLDLDRFSDVNNQYGHALGDSVLRRVARAIKGAVREADIVVRYGGEEFVVIAPSTSDDGAVLAAERIRTAVATATREPVDGQCRAADDLGRGRMPRGRSRRPQPVPGRRFGAAGGEAGGTGPGHADLGSVPGGSDRSRTRPTTRSRQPGVEGRRNDRFEVDRRPGVDTMRRRRRDPLLRAAVVDCWSTSRRTRVHRAARAAPRRASRRWCGTARA